MQSPDKLNNAFRVPQLTPSRIVVALCVAAAADGLQLLFSTAGWFGPNQVVDVLAMLLTSWLLGFHWLLLPTFLLELAPVADDLPTWTACVIAVIILRRRQQREWRGRPADAFESRNETRKQNAPVAPDEKPPIDI